jgi:hypothetical protein
LERVAGEGLKEKKRWWLKIIFDISISNWFKNIKEY